MKSLHIKSLPIFTMLICLVVLFSVQALPVFSNEERVWYNNEGISALNAQDFPLAISMFEQALRIDSSYALAKENLSIACNNYGIRLQNNPKKAITQFHKSMYFNPNNTTTRHNLELLIIALHKNPKAFKDRLKLADDALKEHDRIGALIEYQQALAIEENSAVRSKLKELNRQIVASHR